MTASQTKCLQFTKKFNSDLTDALIDTPLFISTAIAQKCLESGYGTAPLAVNYNNFGGISGRPKYSIGKTSNGWAIFPSPKACFMSYATFLQTLEGGQRYAKALSMSTPEDQIWWLVYSGYCTSPYGALTESARRKNADLYLSKTRGYISILNQKGVGGKITSQNILAYNQSIQNV